MARDSDAIPNLRLQDYRRRLDLTQEQVADELRRLAWEHFGVRVGVDGQMVSKWERGEKRPSRFYRQLLCLLYSTTEEQLGLRVLVVVSTAEDGYDRLEEPVDALEDGLKRRELLRTAATLGAAVMLPDWLGQLAPRQAGEPPELAAVRDALMRYDSLAQDSGNGGEPVPLSVLRQLVDRAWVTFQTSRYSILGPQLPQLLGASQLAARELDGDAKLRASGLLAETYQLAAILLLKLGESNAAWVAADRGILAAERAEDPLVVASGARILAYAFLGAGHFAKAKELTISAAGVLEPGLGRAAPAHLSLYGALLLKGAMAAAYQGDPITSRALLNEGDTAARRLGADANHYFTAFGPTNVGVHRVSAAVALGDGGEALQHAKAVHPVHLPVVERRAQYLVDVARGHGQAGGDDQALRACSRPSTWPPRRSAIRRPPGRWWPSCCIGSGQAGSQNCGPWPSGSAPSPDASRICQAPWRAVCDRLRRPASPRRQPPGPAGPGRRLGRVCDCHAQRPQFHRQSSPGGGDRPSGSLGVQAARCG
jgi:transcriptional regulator with XRE-family HTH domain